MMTTRMPEIPVIVSSDRVAAARYAEEHFKPDIFILDDGYQHLRIRRDMNILILDSSYPFGNGRVFPNGSLREPVSSLNRADAVILSRVGDPEDVRELCRWISDRHPGLPVFTARYQPIGLVSVATGKKEKMEAIQSEKIMAVMGIGHPDGFIGMVRENAGSVEVIAVFPDHYSYCTDDIRVLEKAGARAGVDRWVTTEKDAVRLCATGLNLDRWWAVRMEVALDEPDEFSTLLDKTLGFLKP